MGEESDEMGDESDDENVEDVEDVEFDSVEDEDNMNEARKFVQQIVEGFVDYVGGYDDKFNPINKKAREGEAFGNTQEDGSITGANIKGIWWIVQNEIKEMDINELTKSHAIGCLKNIYRCMKNVDYMSEMEDVTADEISDMVDTMEAEMNKLNRLFSKKGVSSPTLTKISDMVSVYVDKAYGYEDAAAADEPVDDIDADYDEEEPIAPKAPARDVEKENDDAAWAAAKNFDPSMFESRKARRINEEGTKLNVFGKHPGYRKKPMNLPSTGNDTNQWGKDWNDESVYSEQPFGQKVGDSAPFDTIVKATVDSIVESLKKKI